MAVIFNFGKIRYLAYWKAIALIFAVISVIGLYYAFKPPDFRKFTFESQTLHGRRLTMRYPEGWELQHEQKGIMSLKRKRVSFLQSVIEQVVFKITPADETNCNLQISLVSLEGWNSTENWKSRRLIEPFSVQGAKFEVETSEFNNPLGEGYSETLPTPLRNPFHRKFAYLTFSIFNHVKIGTIKGDPLKGDLLLANLPENKDGLTCEGYF